VDPSAGGAPGVEDEKTLLEFVLLGDPSIQPVRSAAAPGRHAARGRAPGPPVLGKFSQTALQERRQRRLFRAQMADQIRGVLPNRSAGKGAARVRAGGLYFAVKDLLKKRARTFGFTRSRVRVHKLETRFTGVEAAAAGFRFAGAKRARVSAASRRESYEYYWTGRRRLGRHKEIRLVRVETDVQGRILRSRIVESS